MKNTSVKSPVAEARRRVDHGIENPELRDAATREVTDLHGLSVEMTERLRLLPPRDIDGCIEEIQRRACTILGVETSVLWQWKVGIPGALLLTHLHHTTGTRLPPVDLDAQKMFPWMLQRVLSGQITIIPSVSRLPQEAACDQKWWESVGYSASVILPIGAWGYPLIGVLSFDTTKERAWREDVVDQLRALGQIIADALARRSAETRLGQSSARLEAAIDSAGLAFYEAAEGGRITFMDMRARSLLDIPAGEDVPIRDIWMRRLHPHDLPFLMEQSRLVLMGGKDRMAIQYRYLHPTRGTLWIDHVIRVLARDTNGHAMHLVGVFQDITERKQSEAALRSMAQQYDTLTSTTTDGYMEVDEEGRIRAANDVACRMSGYSAEELHGLSVMDIEAAMSEPQIVDTMDRIRRTGLARFETKHRRKDGSLIDVEVSTTWFRQTRRFVVFLRDVTERMKNQRELHESLEFNRTILASLVDNIVILDRRGTILATNDAWDQFAITHGADVPARVGVGVNYLDVCRQAGEFEVLEEIEAVMSGRRDFYRLEYLAPTPRENRWYLMEVMPLRRQKGGVVVVHRDVTERRKADEELQRLRTEIWHAHRVAQTGTISASLAHELNQPLAAILSNAQAGLQVMAAATPDLEEIRAILTDIVHDDNRAASVIAGLRAMLRRKETQREKIDLETTIREVLALSRSELIANDVEVELSLEPACALLADKAQIQQVILNLVMNAIEAVAGQDSERRHLTISLTREPSRDALLAVSDWGRGIPEDEQKRVFDAFWTTKPHGMGIGLPICRSILESHGGQLWFESNADCGVTFFASLPLLPEPPTEPTPR